MIKTFEDYLDFLNDYWEIFGPIPSTRKHPWVETKMLL